MPVGVPPEPRPHRLSDVVGALSHALDLTEGQPVGHAQRSCMIGMEVAERMGLDGKSRTDLFYASLLKDAGCSSSAARMCELFRADDRALKRDFTRVDWSRRGEVLRYAARHAAPGASRMTQGATMLRALRGLVDEGAELSQTRCDRGARIVAMLGFSTSAAAAVRGLDEHWDGSGVPGGLTGDAIPPLSRIACLAQTVEVFLATDGPSAAREVVEARRGRWFDPEVADAFLAIGPDDPLWTRVADDEAAAVLAALEPEGGVALADEEGLDRVAEAFADVIDAKSPFTARHSRGVALFAVLAGERLGLDETGLRALRRAGLLHDVGKLGVSNTILDKPGKLTEAEMDEVRRHPRYTAEILSRVPAFAPIAAAAAAHHERLDGRGYHLGLPAERLSREARILAVADVYEALTADRPYRGPMAPHEALEILWRDAGTAFDRDCVGALRDGLLGAPPPAPVEAEPALTDSRPPPLVDSGPLPVTSGSAAAPPRSARR